MILIEIRVSNVNGEVLGRVLVLIPVRVICSSNSIACVLFLKYLVDSRGTEVTNLLSKVLVTVSGTNLIWWFTF